MNTKVRRGLETVKPLKRYDVKKFIFRYKGAVLLPVKRYSSYKTHPCRLWTVAERLASKCLALGNAGLSQGLLEVAADFAGDGSGG